MTKDNIVFLKHIIESIGYIESFIRSRIRDEFDKSVELQDALSRRLEIIGEAAKNIDDDFKQKHKEIEWKKIVGMRDVMIHKYFEIDLDLVWNTVKEDLPKLKKEISKILRES